MLACPSCGTPVDPLRAGHVAVYGGRFFYFCNRGCKVVFAENAAIGPADVRTAIPPHAITTEFAAGDAAAVDETSGVVAFPKAAAPAEAPTPEPIARREPRYVEWFIGASAAFGFVAGAVALTRDKSLVGAWALALASSALLAASALVERGSRASSRVLLSAALVAGALIFSGFIGSSVAISRVVALAGFASFAFALVQIGERRDADAEGERPEEAWSKSPQWVALAQRWLIPTAGVASLLIVVAAYLNGARRFELVVSGVAAFAAILMTNIDAALARLYAKAHGEASARGVKYSDAAVFHRAGEVQSAVICARGTVLSETPEFLEVVAIGEIDSDRVLGLAAASDAFHSHSVFAAISGAASERGVVFEELLSPMMGVGVGYTAYLTTGDRVVVGRRSYLLRQGVSVAAVDARIASIEANGGGRGSAVLVALADRIVGLIELRDEPREGAREAIAQLSASHIDPVLISGESRETCEAIAATLGIEHIRPEVLAEETAIEVRSLRESGQVVAAIGTPASPRGALAAADLAILLAREHEFDGSSVHVTSEKIGDAAFALVLARSVRRKAVTVAAIALAPASIALLACAIVSLRVWAVPLVALCGPLATLSYLRRNRAALSSNR